MFQKLFQITLVLFLVIVSIVVLGLVISVVMTTWSPGIHAESGGFGRVVALSNRQLGYIIVAASLIVAGCYLFFRRGRFRR